MFINLIQNLRTLKEQEKLKIRKPLSLISVLIPARNEERNIKNCVTSILESDYPNLEIIVLDDNSTDKTYKIVRKLCRLNKNLKIIKGKKLPQGWNGKNWACHQLSQVARGKWFLFTDADTIHAPQSISLAFAAAQDNNSSFVTYIPELITKTWAEKLYLPIIHFAFYVLIPFKLVNYSKNSHLAFGIGPFLLISKKIYLSLGGYEKIKADIVDDIALAKQVKKNDGKISVLNGTRIMKVRFYTCFKEIWNGFSKNEYEAIGNAPHYLVGIFFACHFLFIYPYLSLLVALTSNNSITLPLFQVLTISVIKIILSLRFHTSITYGLLHPFTIILALLILLNSFRLSFFKKKFEWKERYYPIE